MASLVGLHIHHDLPAEYINPKEGGLERRERYIKFCKPECEHEKRLGTMKEVPDYLLPQDVLLAARAVDEELHSPSYNFVSYMHKCRELTKVIWASSEFRALHGYLCPNCPWGDEIWKQE